MKNNLTGIDEDKLINYEIIGNWPIYKLTLREILIRLGAVDRNGFIGFNTNDKILNLYPQKFNADIMGYGINEEWFTDISSDNETYISVFTDRQLSDKELDAYKKEQIKAAKEIKDWYDRRQLESSQG